MHEAGAATVLKPFEDRNMFRHFLEEFHAIRRSLRGSRPHAWVPPTDIYETDRDFVIQVSLPGVHPADLSVRCNGEVITVCGVRHGPDPQHVVAYHQMEIPHGYFERHVVIHAPFDPEGARAHYKDGFLHVVIPKAPQMIKHMVVIRLSV